MSVFYLHPRGTKAALTALAAANGLKANQIYYMTDVGKLALATAVNAFVTFSKDGTCGIPFVIDGGGVAIAAGQQVDLPDLPSAATITGWTITTDASATCSVDILRATYANFPGTIASIAGTEKPSTTAAQKNQDVSLTTWTTALAQGDCLRASVSANDNATRITVMLRVVWS